MSFYIRKMALTDVDDVLAIEKLSFNDPWSKEAMEHEAAGNEAALYLVGIEAERRRFGQGKKREQLIAYAGLWMILDEGHITNIAVHPDYRRQKKGVLLVSKLIEEAKAAGVNHFTLEVKTTNAPAIAMYESLGFQKEGIRKNYYQDDNSDAYIMWRRS